MALDSILKPTGDEDSGGGYAPSAPSFKTNPQLDAMLTSQATAKEEADSSIAKAKADEAERAAEVGKIAERTAGYSAEVEKLQANAPKAPDLDRAPKPSHTDPYEAFGSTASVLALIGSAFTKRPLQNALNNAAGVIEAFKANDTQRAKEEMDLWKANTDMAVQQFNLQNTAYKEALDAVSTKGAMAMNDLQILAAQYGDPIMKNMAVTRAYDAAFDLQKKRETGVLDLETTTGKLTNLFALRDDPAYLAASPVKRAEMENEIINPSKALSGGGKGQSVNIRVPGVGIVAGRADQTGRLSYTDADGNEVEAPPGSRRMSVAAGGPLTADQLLKRKLELNDEQQGAKLLKKYFATVKDIPTGMARWATDLSMRGKTLFGQPLSQQEEALGYSRAMIQRLLGLNRQSVVGGGVMTEYDAARVIEALGGYPGGVAGAFQNPQVLQRVLSDMYQYKLERIALYQEQISNSDADFATPMTAPTSAPPVTPTAPTTPERYAPPSPTGGDDGTTKAQGPDLQKANTDWSAFPEADKVKARALVAKGKPIPWRDPTTKQLYNLTIDPSGNLIPVQAAPKGPGGGPLDEPYNPNAARAATPASNSRAGLPMEPISDAAAPPPRARAVPQPQKIASSMVNPPPNAQPARAAAPPALASPALDLTPKPPLPARPRVEFGAALQQPLVLGAQPTVTPRAPTPRQPNQEALDAARRDVPTFSRGGPETSDIEVARRASAERFDKLVGRKKEERGKPRRYKLTKDADGSTIVEVLH